MSINASWYTSNKDDWETPQALFDELNARFHFSVDLAASDDNHKCDRYITREQNSLEQDWQEIGGSGALFLNPPYGRDMKRWVEKAWLSSIEYPAPIVLVIPARTDTSYWHDYIFGKAHVEFLRGRLKFEHGGVAGDSAPFPSAIVAYNYAEVMTNEPT